MKKSPENRKRKRAAQRTTKRQSRVRQQSTLEIMERLLSSIVGITVSGVATWVSVLEAIILQVMQKAMAGNGRGFRMLADYQELASKRASGPAPLRFVENDYTRIVAKDLSRDN
jgi:hypothetical protein